MATKLNPNAIIDSSISKEKLQQWVIKWDDTEIDAAIWDELTSFDQLPSKIPNIVFMNEGFKVYALQQVYAPSSGTKELYFSAALTDYSDLAVDWYMSSTIVTLSSPKNGKCSVLLSTASTDFVGLLSNGLDSLDDNSVDGTKLKDATVTQNKIAPAAIVTSKIRDLNVSEDKLATNSVTTSKIKDATITPSKLAPSVMQHLEAITIYTDNTAEHKAANLANIKVYENNLKAMGINVTNGYIIPIICSPSTYCGILNSRGSNYYDGICNVHNSVHTLGFKLDGAGNFTATDILDSATEFSNLTTTAKRIIPAINEVNGKIGDIDTILDKIIG